MGTGTIKFHLSPLAPFRLDLTVWTLRRRAENLVDRWDGATYRRVLPVGGLPVEVSVRQVAPRDTPELQVSISGASARTGIKAAVAHVLERMFGMRVDLDEFYRFAASDAQLDALVDRFRGMRPPRFHTVFEALVNGFACQQLSLTLGMILLGRLSQQYGLAIGEANAVSHAFPRPEDLAALEPRALRRLGFSYQKSRAIIDAARAVCEEQFDLESLAGMPDNEARDRLEQLHGVGRWTAEYVLLRGLGRWHVFPSDDVGARNSLARWLNLKTPLDHERAERLLARWKGYGGLIYFHLLLDHLAAVHLVR
jgi:DNA-3-methyladenine glycosylase II